MKGTISSIFDTLFPMEPIVFNKRFSRNTNPDANDYKISRGVGEFSVDTEMNFEKHLKRLYKRKHERQG